MLTLGKEGRATLADRSPSRQPVRQTELIAYPAPPATQAVSSVVRFLRTHAAAEAQRGFLRPTRSEEPAHKLLKPSKVASPGERNEPGSATALAMESRLLKQRLA